MTICIPLQISIFFFKVTIKKKDIEDIEIQSWEGVRTQVDNIQLVNVSLRSLLARTISG